MRKRFLVINYFYIWFSKICLFCSYRSWLHIYENNYQITINLRKASVNQGVLSILLCREYLNDNLSKNWIRLSEFVTIFHKEDKVKSTWMEFDIFLIKNLVNLVRFVDFLTSYYRNIHGICLSEIFRKLMHWKVSKVIVSQWNSGYGRTVTWSVK